MLFAHLVAAVLHSHDAFSEEGTAYEVVVAAIVIRMAGEEGFTGCVSWV